MITITGTRYRDIYPQSGVSWSTSVQSTQTSGHFQFSFSGASGLCTLFDLYNGKILSSNKSLIGSYVNGDNLNFSGNLSPSGADLYLNSNPLYLGYAITNSNQLFTKVVLNNLGISSINFDNLTVYGGTTAPYSYQPFYTFYKSQANIPISITNSGSYNLVIYSGSCANDAFKFTGQSPLLTLGSNGQNYVYLSNTKSINIGQKQISLPITLYSNIGNINLSVNVSGIITGKSPSLINLGPNISTITNGKINTYALTYRNITKTPTTISLSGVSGYYGTVYSPIQITGLSTGLISGTVYGSGYLQQFVSVPPLDNFGWHTIGYAGNYAIPQYGGVLPYSLQRYNPILDVYETTAASGVLVSPDIYVAPAQSVSSGISYIASGFGNITGQDINSNIRYYIDCSGVLLSAVCSGFVDYITGGFVTGNIPVGTLASTNVLGQFVTGSLIGNLQSSVLPYVSNNIISVNGGLSVDNYSYKILSKNVSSYVTGTFSYPWATTGLATATGITSDGVFHSTGIVIPIIGSYPYQISSQSQFGQYTFNQTPVSQFVRKGTLLLQNQNYGPQNLLLSSNPCTGLGWSSANLTLTGSKILAPNGVGTATLLKRNSSSTALLGQAVSKPVASTVTNLLTYSNNFTGVGAWNPNNGVSSISTNNTDPFGGNTATQFSGNVFGAGYYQFPAMTDGVTYTFSVYAKYITGNSNLMIGKDNWWSIWNLSGGAQYNGGVTSYPLSHSAQSMGNNWYRLSQTWVQNTALAGNTAVSVYAYNAGGSVFQIYGAQLESGVSITGNYVDTTSSAITQNFSAPDLYTFSTYVKPLTGNYCALRMQGNYPSTANIVFNLANSTISYPPYAGPLEPWGIFSNITGAITKSNNGWYRVSLTANTDTWSSLSVFVSFNSNNAIVDGTDSVSNSCGYVWGAQLQKGTQQTYIQTKNTSTVVNWCADHDQYVNGNITQTLTPYGFVNFNTNYTGNFYNPSNSTIYFNQPVSVSAIGAGLVSTNLSTGVYVVDPSILSNYSSQIDSFKYVSTNKDLYFTGQMIAYLPKTISGVLIYTNNSKLITGTTTGGYYNESGNNIVASYSGMSPVYIFNNDGNKLNITPYQTSSISAQLTGSYNASVPGRLSIGPILGTGQLTGMLYSYQGERSFTGVWKMATGKNISQLKYLTGNNSYIGTISSGIGLSSTNISQIRVSYVDLFSVSSTSQFQDIANLAVSAKTNFINNSGSGKNIFINSITSTNNRNFNPSLSCPSGYVWNNCWNACVPAYILHMGTLQPAYWNPARCWYGTDIPLPPVLSYPYVYIPPVASDTYRGIPTQYLLG